MSDQMIDSKSARQGRYDIWHQILAVAMVVGVLIQAVLGSQGLFQANTGIVSLHEMLGNVVFLIVVAQLVLGFIAFRAGTMDMTGNVLRVVLLVLVIAQIGLGYSTRTSVDATAWHISNGVLLMGVSTIIAVMSWNRSASV